MTDLSGLDTSIGWWTGVAALGLIVGLVAGMFGVGGGFILVPLLNVVFKVPIQIAVGTGLCQMIGTGVAAYRRHSKIGQGETKIDWLMMGGALVGVQVGAYAVALLRDLGSVSIGAHTIPAIKIWLSLGFAVVLVMVAGWMLYDARTRKAGTNRVAGPIAKILIPPMTELPQSKRSVS